MNRYASYYFLGIGGIGMSALARYYKQMGCHVLGYDRTETELTKHLIEEGIDVHYDEDVQRLPNANGVLVIYTPAIPEHNLEYQYCRKNGYKMIKRAELLGNLTRDKNCIAVAGTHGKTTTSGLIAHLLANSSIGVNAFLGGVSINYNSNLIIDKDSDYVVVEADEYDKSFLNLYPDYTVVTSIDPDHLDIYNDYETLFCTFQQFVNQTKDGGKIFLKKDLELEINGNKNIERYGLDDIEGDYYMWNLRIYKGSYFFDLCTPGKVFYDIEMNYPGIHNIENAIVASAVALKCGISEIELREGLKTFKGIKRRFEYRIKDERCIFIDDYAHHPRELAATISSVKQLYPNKKIMGVFQPHLYSRTRDFSNEFAEVLSSLDEVILLDIYPAREEPIEGVSSKLILHKIHKMDKYICGKKELADVIVALDPEVIITMGAGDIDQLVLPIELALKESKNIK